MRIGIDVSPIIYDTGVSVYTEELVRNLIAINKDNSYVLYGGSLRRIKELNNFVVEFEKGNVERKIFPFPPTIADFIWNRLHIIKVEELVGRLDVFHSSDWTQPPSTAFKVTTIHDVIPILFPEQSHPKIVSTHRRRLSLVKKEVDRIISPSLTTKKDLIKLGFDPRIIRVIPEAPSPIFEKASLESIKNLRNKYGIAENYLLSVGMTPRKNTQKIIKSYRVIKNEMDCELVIIGQEYVKIKAGKGVKILGNLPKRELPVLYSGAKALVYPSLYEGFGLPILEAFACKIPVVTSKYGSMKEVSGNAAVLVNPRKVDSIVRGIIRALQTRESLISKGEKQLKNYSWEETARQTLEVYRESIK